MRVEQAPVAVHVQARVALSEQFADQRLEVAADPQRQAVIRGGRSPSFWWYRLNGLGHSAGASPITIAISLAVMPCLRASSHSASVAAGIRTPAIRTAPRPAGHAGVLHRQR